jgi:hypothetical protein
MYGLPQNIDLSFLKERKLESVCFAAYQVNLHFDNGAMISIFGTFRHFIIGEDSAGKTAQFPLSSSNLMRLLTQTVTKVQSQADGTLELAFSNNDTLVIYDDTKQYESYHIKNGERLIIV